MKSELIHKDISEDIIGAAMAVLNELKPGLDEKVIIDTKVVTSFNDNHIAQMM